MGIAGKDILIVIESCINWLILGRQLELLFSNPFRKDVRLYYGRIVELVALCELRV